MKKGLVIGLIAGGALLFLASKSSSSGSGRKVYLPNGQIVFESELPALGYIKYNGVWYHRTQFPSPPAGQPYGGYNTNSPQWQQILLTLVNTGLNLFNQFTGGQPPTGGGLGAGGGGAGGGGASGAFGLPTISDVLFTDAS